jgi:hypothetical protein
MKKPRVIECWVKEVANALVADCHFSKIGGLRPTDAAVSAVRTQRYARCTNETDGDLDVYDASVSNRSVASSVHPLSTNDGEFQTPTTLMERIFPIDNRSIAGGGMLHPLDGVKKVIVAPDIVLYDM